MYFHISDFCIGSSNLSAVQADPTPRNTPLTQSPYSEAQKLFKNPQNNYCKKYM